MPAVTVSSVLTFGIPRISSTPPAMPREAFMSPCAVSFTTMDFESPLTSISTSQTSRLPNWAILMQTAWRLGSSESGVNVRIIAALSSTCSTQA